MSISAVSSTTSIPPDPGPDNPTDAGAAGDTPAGATSTAGLTPDAFFAYCEAQMNGIDVEASGYFDQQQSSNVAKQTLNTIVGELQQHSGGFTDQTTVDNFKQELQTLQSQYPQATTQIGDMIHLLTTDGKPGTGEDDVVSANDVQQLISQLNDLSTQMDSSNQLSMIKLQSAMSAREQVLQLTSNILQAVDSGDSKVIGNIHS